MRSMLIGLGCAVLFVGACKKTDKGAPSASGSASSSTQGSGSAAPAGSGSSARAQCDLAAHEWKQSSAPPGCAESTYKFTAKVPGSFEATETGCWNLTGTARYDGSTIIFEAQHDGNTLQYIWPVDASCASGPGQAKWLTGPDVGKGGDSTLTMR